MLAGIVLGPLGLAVGLFDTTPLGQFAGTIVIVVLGLIFAWSYVHLFVLEEARVLRAQALTRASGRSDDSRALYVTAIV